MSRAAKVPDPSVCIVILTYNGREDTLACLAAMEAMRPRPWDLGLVAACDNGSADGSAEAVLAWAKARGLNTLESDGRKPAPRRSGFRGLALVRNGGNLGFAAGCNPGLRLGLAMGARHFWLLNNDTLPEPEALAALLAQADGRTILGSTVLQAHDPSLVQVAGGCRYNPLTTVLAPHMGGRSLKEALASAEEPRLDYVHGASMLVPRAALESVGLLNEEHFLFYEELDFCRRARDAGFRLGWCRGSLVRHKGGASLGREPGALACYHENLSTLLFTRNHHPWLLPPAAALRLAGKAAVLTARGQARLLAPLARAYLDFCSGRRRMG